LLHACASISDCTAHWFYAASIFARLQDQLVIIDVSQAVDLDHPKALDFLREDCAHVNDFFRRGGVAVLTNRELFDYTVDPNINDSNEAAVLEELQQRAAR
jgi:RIO kinase 1